MNGKDIRVNCPYCGTGNSLEDKTCHKCGNRIPKSAIEKVMNSKDEPPIAISNNTEETNSKLNRKAISPLKRRGSILAKREENKTVTVVDEKKEEPVKVQSVLEIVQQSRDNQVDAENVEAGFEELEVKDELPTELGDNAVEDASKEEKNEEHDDPISQHSIEVIEADKDKDVVESTLDKSEIEEAQELKEEDDSVDESESSSEDSGVEANAFEVEKESDYEEEKSLADDSIEEVEGSSIETIEDAKEIDDEVDNEDDNVKKTLEVSEPADNEPILESAETEEVAESDEEEQNKTVGETEKKLYDTNVEYIVQEWNRNYKPVEKALEDEIVLPDDEDEGEEIIDIKPQNDIIKIKNDISEYLKAQEEIDLDTTVCLNVPDVMNALYKSEANEDDEFLNTHVYPNLEGELYESGIEADKEGTVEEQSLYEEDDTDLETREYQLDMQVLEDNVAPSTNKNESKGNLASKIKKAHKENKEKKIADETRLNIPVYFLGVLLRPLTMHEKEKDKLNKFKNVGKMVIVIIFAMTVLGLFREMLNVIRETSYWTGEISWAWDKLGTIQYFKVLGDKLLIYTGIIGGFSAVYYVVSVFMKKKTDIIELISVVCTAFIPLGIAYGIVSLILSLIYMPLAIIVTIVGFIYSMLILLELIDELIVVEEKNKRLLFHLVSLSIIFVISGLLIYSYLMTLA